MRGKLSDALESCIFNNVSEAAFLKTAGDRCSVLSCLPVCLFACLPLQSVHCDGSRFASPAGSWCLVKLSSCRQSLHSLSLSPRMSPLSVLPSFVPPPPSLESRSHPLSLSFLYSPSLCLLLGRHGASFFSNINHAQVRPRPGEGSLYACALVRLKVVVISGTYVFQYTGPLCCFILEEWKNKKSPQNSPAREKKREGREREQRGEGRGGRGGKRKGKVGEGLGTEP